MRYYRYLYSEYNISLLIWSWSCTKTAFESPLEEINIKISSLVTPTIHRQCSTSSGDSRGEALWDKGHISQDQPFSHVLCPSAVKDPCLGCAGAFWWQELFILHLQEECSWLSLSVTLREFPLTWAGTARDMSMPLMGSFTPRTARGYWNFTRISELPGSRATTPWLIVSAKRYAVGLKSRVILSCPESVITRLWGCGLCLF